MSAKTVLIVCAQALLVKTILAQYYACGDLGQAARAAQTLPQGPPSPTGPNFTPNPSGGPFIVTSSSPISPTGLNIAADDLVIEGPLDVNGSLPFLGTVALDGSIQVDGSTSVVFGCGNGNVGITNERAGCNLL